MAFLDPVTLQAGGVRLEPLGLHHAGPLADAMGDDDPAKEWFARTPSAADVASDIDAKLQAAAAGQWLPFAVLNEGTAVGQHVLPAPAIRHPLRRDRSHVARSRGT
jgi:hypothetical protein